MAIESQLGMEAVMDEQQTVRRLRSAGVADETVLSERNPFPVQDGISGITLDAVSFRLTMRPFSERERIVEKLFGVGDDGRASNRVITPRLFTVRLINHVRSV